jgi:uncharacterized protein YjbI with pentapeptide repeats
MRQIVLVATCAALVCVAPAAHADIFQWEYINPADPGQGKQQNTMIAPDGAGVDAVPGADLSSLNLTMAYLVGAELYSIYECDEFSCHEQKTNLSGTNLTDADLTSASLFFANLSGANLHGTYLTNANLASATLSGSGAGITLAQLYSTASYQAHDLSGTTFQWSGFAGGDFVGQNLTNTDFEHTILTDADFRGANLNSANLSYAHVTGADFTGAEIRGASFNAAFCSLAPPPGCSKFGTGVTPAQLYCRSQFRRPEPQQCELPSCHAHRRRFR